MQWLEITINSNAEGIPVLCSNLESLGVEGLVIEDEAAYNEFLEKNRQYWDYVDQKFADSIKGLSRVKFYLEDSADGLKSLQNLKEALPDQEFLVKQVRDEDWENNWREYYKPIAVGDRLLIVPEWEETPNTEGRAVLRLDPGLIFGTGAHATTQMCLKTLEKLAFPGKSVLDLGCGSGILAIASLLLGADTAVGCDIDPKAPRVAMENAGLNEIHGDRFSVYAGDVLSDKHLKKIIGAKKYDIVLANIVAEVIIALSGSVLDWLAPGGTFVCSGIIDGRQDEVKRALITGSLQVISEFRQEDWHCFECRAAE